MAVSMWAQAAGLLYALLFGLLCGALYDGIRILRVLHGVHYGGQASARIQTLRPRFLPPPRPHGRVGERAQGALIFLEDVLYLAVAGALFSVFVYWQNDGVFRSHLLVGTLLGFFAYYFTVGRLVLSAAESLAALLRLLFACLFFLAALPVRFLWRRGKRGALWLGRTMRRFLRRTRVKLLLPLYARREARRLLASAQRGFLN